MIARFSSSTGIPDLPDTDPNGNPRGFALRFSLAETPRRVHTDIISHSVPFFPAPDGQSALEFFQSIPNGTIGEYVASHPAALAFVQAPKPFPSSFGREAYYSVNAFKLVSTDGKGTFVRYRFVPVAGEDHLSDDAAKEKSANYLFDGVPETLKTGPIQFQLKAQVAQDGDVTDDNTKHWPDDREIVDLGLVSLESVYEDADQKTIIFDPVPRVEGGGAIGGSAAGHSGFRLPPEWSRKTRRLMTKKALVFAGVLYALVLVRVGKNITVHSGQNPAQCLPI